MNGQYETIFLSYNKTMLGNTSLPVNLNFPLYKLNLLNFKPSCEHTVVLPDRVQGRIQEFVQGGLKFFAFQGGAQHPLGHENPQKLIDFTGPGGGA